MKMGVVKPPVILPHSRREFKLPLSAKTVQLSQLNWRLFSSLTCPESVGEKETQTAALVSGLLLSFKKHLITDVFKALQPYVQIVFAIGQLMDHYFNRVDFRIQLFRPKICLFLQRQHPFTIISFIYIYSFAQVISPFCQNNIGQWSYLLGSIS